MTILSNEQVQRYSRHLIMPEVGVQGQEQLLRSKVLLIGAGGLGSPCALYLAAAGVGTLGIVDYDAVDFSNLQRQILHTTDRVGQPKVKSAIQTLKGINSDVKVVPYQERLSSENALALFQDYEVVVDGTDNFPTRYLVNDACVLAGKPNVYGSIFRFEGQASVFDARKGPCYRCLYPEPPPPGLVPSCAEGGVLGILPGLIGVIQATETIKLLLGKPGTLIGRLLTVDAMRMRFKELELRKDPDCPLCGSHPTITGLMDYEEFCGLGRGEEAAAPAGETRWNLAPKALAQLLKSPKPPVLVDVREPEEFQICRLPGARLIPLATLADRINELDSSEEIVVYCKRGMRSLDAARFLDQVGFRKLRHLTGGIEAWAKDVDPSLPTY